MSRKFENGGVVVWRATEDGFGGEARYTTKGASVDLGVITRSEAEKFAWLWAARFIANEDQLAKPCPVRA